MAQIDGPIYITRTTLEDEINLARKELDGIVFMTRTRTTIIVEGAEDESEGAMATQGNTLIITYNEEFILPN